MVHRTAISTDGQLTDHLQRLARDEGAPFLDLLSQTLVEDICTRVNHVWRDRIYTPWITLCVFLSQVIADDQSCNSAASRFQSYRKTKKLHPVSSCTTSYCDFYMGVTTDFPRHSIVTGI